MVQMAQTDHLSLGAPTHRPAYVCLCRQGATAGQDETAKSSASGFQALRFGLQVGLFGEARHIGGFRVACRQRTDGEETALHLVEGGAIGFWRIGGQPS